MSARNRATPFPSPGSNGARVVADIGGTNARFATLGATAHDLERIEVLRCADYRSIEDAIDHYRRTQGIDSLGEVCLAVAGPTDQDRTDPPNNPWAFSRRALERDLGAPLTVINDFTAQARCIDALYPGELSWLGEPRPTERGIRAVLGPGTGLGVSVETLQGEIIPSEGGHAGFAPTNGEEVEVLRLLMSRFGRVSAERLLSGPGLENLYWAHRRIAEPQGPAMTNGPSAAEIADLAAQGDSLAAKTVGSFFDVLASFAGDVALFAWATGGVYLSGGVMHKLAAFLDPERFRARFEEKGRFSRFCQAVPVAWISHELPGLLGCAAALLQCSPTGLSRRS
jgi:glucokinase